MIRAATNVRRTAIPAALLLPALLSACSLPNIVGSEQAGTARQTSVRGQPAPIGSNPQTRQCLAALGESGARFTPLPDRYLGEGCSNLGTVQLTALPGERDAVGVTSLGPVTCPVSAAFAAWTRFGVDRAARQILGSPVVSIQTMGSYSCRNVAGSTRRSAHATAAAIDIAGFTLADGRRITVADNWNGAPAERRFLRTIQQSACRRFATVLGPEYNAAHRNHLHFEGVISGDSYCR